MMFFLVNCGLAVVHMLMAGYIQWKLKKQINEQHMKELKEKAQAEEEGDADYARGTEVPKQEIVRAAAHIFWTDILFCLYFFVFFFSIGYNFYSLSMLNKDCAETGPGWSAGTIMILYGFFM